MTTVDRELLSAMARHQYECALAYPPGHRMRRASMTLAKRLDPTIQLPEFDDIFRHVTSAPFDGLFG